MKKAVLVIDMPYSCSECPLVYGNDLSDWCYPMGHFNGDVFRHTQDNTKPDWCPLREVPQIELSDIPYESDYASYARGFYDCLDKIL